MTKVCIFNLANGLTNIVPRNLLSLWKTLKASEMMQEVAEQMVYDIDKSLRLKGLQTDIKDEGILEVHIGKDTVSIKYANGLVSLSNGEVLNRLTVLKALTGNPPWIDDVFVTALGRVVKAIIRQSDPEARLFLKTQKNRKFQILYEDQPILTIKSDDLFTIISGISNEWDNAIPAILSNVDNELPSYFWTVPIEWTVVADPIVDPEWFALAKEEGVNLMELILNYISSRPTLLDMMYQVVDLFFKKGGWLEQFAIEKGIPYQERDSQITMAKKVLNTLLTSQKKLIVEAPTGTGKTFAYLVPAYIIAWVINRTVQSQVSAGLIDTVFEQANYRIAVSTHTITLQKQIYSKDLPVIEEIFDKRLMFKLSYAIAMGRNNYVCLRQTHEYLATLENSIKGKLEGIEDDVIERKAKFISFVRKIIDEKGLNEGLIDELQNLLSDSYEDLFLDMRENIQSDNKNTLKDQCPFRDQCFYYTNKEKWQSANILIMNHYLLALVLDIYPSYFRNIYGIIVDEGHHFPEVVRQQRGRIDFTIAGIVRSMEKRMKRFREIADWMRGQGIPYRLKFLQNMSLIGNHVFEDYMEKLEEAEKKLTSLKMFIDNVSETRVAQIVDVISNDQNPRENFSIPIKPVEPLRKALTYLSMEDIKKVLSDLRNILNDLKVEVQNLEYAIEDLIKVVLDGYQKAIFDIPGNEADSLKKYIETLEESIGGFFSAYTESFQDFIVKIDEALEIIEGVEAEEDCSKYAYWIEIRRDRRASKKRKFNIKLQKQAVFSGDLCRELISGSYIPFVFTSATMTTLGRFDFFISSAGLDESTHELEMEKLPPVFNYDSQMEIWVPEDAPDVNKETEYVSFLVENLKRWLVESHGQALVLFTSVALMRTVYDQVKDYVLSKGIDVYVQDEGMSRDMLLKTFKQNRYSVLFATKTFWEGIDIQGDSLQLLIITRLPFPNPNDINEQALKKCFAQQDKDKFMEYDVPVAGMLLRQAVGRLIRSEHDSGVVIITDKRIISQRKQYAELLRESLPVQIVRLPSREITARLGKQINKD